MLTRTLAVLSVLGLAVVGCEKPVTLMKEPDMVCAPTQLTRDLWATVRTIAANRIAIFEAACKAGTVSAPLCRQGAEDIAAMRALDFDITRKLNNPKAVLDVEKVTKILEVSAKIIGALAP